MEIEARLHKNANTKLNSKVSAAHTIKHIIIILSVVLSIDMYKFYFVSLVNTYLRKILTC